MDEDKTKVAPADEVDSYLGDDSDLLEDDSLLDGLNLSELDDEDADKEE